MATLTVTGLTALVTAYAEAMIVLKVFGAAYLLWLAYKAFRSACTPAANIIATAAKGENLYWRGLLIQMTNPKAALHWIAIVGIGLGAEAPFWIGIALVFSTTAFSILGHLAYALAFSTAPVVAFYHALAVGSKPALAFFSVSRPSRLRRIKLKNKDN